MARLLKIFFNSIRGASPDLSGDPDDPGVAELPADHGGVLEVPAVITDVESPHSDMSSGWVCAVTQTDGPGTSAGPARHHTLIETSDIRH